MSGLTYRAWIDGPAVTYFGGLAASVVAMTLALQVQVGWRNRSTWPITILAIMVALPAPAIHAARVINRHHRVEQTLEAPLAYGAVLDVTLQGDASLVVLDQAIVVHDPAGSVGYLEVRRPPTGLARWWLPWGLATGDDLRVHETVIWTASVEREHGYFVMLDTGTLLVQLTSWGLTAASFTGHPGSEVHDVPLALPNGSTHTWALDRYQGMLQLKIDGRPVVSLPDAGPFRFVRLGETRSDAEHGGTIRLSALRLTRTLD